MHGWIDVVQGGTSIHGFQISCPVGTSILGLAVGCALTVKMDTVHSSDMDGRIRCFDGVKKFSRVDLNLAISIMVRKQQKLAVV